MRYLLLILTLVASVGVTNPALAKTVKAKPVTFVMQLTMSD